MTPGVTAADITWAAGPFIHCGCSPENYELLGFHEKADHLDLGRRTGHLGAGDQWAGLNHLAQTRFLTPGDLVLLDAAGAGFTLSAAVLEILHQPTW